MTQTLTGRYVSDDHFNQQWSNASLDAIKFTTENLPKSFPCFPVDFEAMELRIWDECTRIRRTYHRYENKRQRRRNRHR